MGLDPRQQASLPDGIIGIGRTQDQQELAQLYSLASLFLNLTYEDNYPTTNLEAMACGTPVLTYRTGGSPEAVTPETGWVLEQGDVEGVAGIVRQVAEMPAEEQAALGLRCRERALKAFDKKQCFEQYFSLYQELTRSV